MATTNHERVNKAMELLREAGTLRTSRSYR